MEKKSRKRKLIGFIAGEKGSIGKLQALALGIGGFIAGGLIPKIVQAWDDGWSGDWGDAWSGDWGDYWSGDWDYWDNWPSNWDYWDNWPSNWDYWDYWPSDWPSNWDYWDYWPSDWPSDWDYTWPSDWSNTWSGDYINYEPTQEPVSSTWDSGDGPYPSIGSGEYDNIAGAEGGHTLIYVYEYDADGNITGGQEVIVEIVSVGDEVQNGGAWYAAFRHPSWEYDHLGLITSGGGDGGGGGGDGGGWPSDWPANTAPSAEVEVK